MAFRKHLSGRDDLGDCRAQGKHLTQLLLEDLKMRITIRGNRDFVLLDGDRRRGLKNDRVL
jgi:hypothetical protein